MFYDEDRDCTKRTACRIVAVVYGFLHYVYDFCTLPILSSALSYK